MDELELQEDSVKTKKGKVTVSDEEGNDEVEDDCEHEEHEGDFLANIDDDGDGDDNEELMVIIRSPKEYKHSLTFVSIFSLSFLADSYGFHLGRSPQRSSQTSAIFPDTPRSGVLSWRYVCLRSVRKSPTFSPCMLHPPELSTLHQPQVLQVHVSGLFVSHTIQCNANARSASLTECVRDTLSTRTAKIAPAGEHHPHPPSRCLVLTPQSR